MKKLIRILISVTVTLCLAFSLFACSDAGGNNTAKPEIPNDNVTEEPTMLTAEEFAAIKDATLAYAADSDKYLCVEAFNTDIAAGYVDYAKNEFCGKIQTFGTAKTTDYYTSDDPSVRYEKTASGEWRYYKTDGSVDGTSGREMYITIAVSAADLFFPFCAPKNGKYVMDEKYFAEGATPFIEVLAAHYKNNAEILEIIAASQEQKIDFGSFAFAVDNGKITLYEIKTATHKIRMEFAFDETKTLTLPELSECTIMYGTSFALPIDVSLNSPVTAQSDDTTLIYYRFTAEENGLYKVKTPDTQSLEAYLTSRSEPVAANLRYTEFKLDKGESIYISARIFNEIYPSFEIVPVEKGSSPLYPAETLNDLCSGGGEISLLPDETKDAVYYYFVPDAIGDVDFSCENATLEIFEIHGAAQELSGTKFTAYDFQTIRFEQSYDSFSSHAVNYGNRFVITVNEVSDTALYIIRISDMQNGAKLDISFTPCE